MLFTLVHVVMHEFQFEFFCQVAQKNARVREKHVSIYIGGANLAGYFHSYISVMDNITTQRSKQINSRLQIPLCTSQIWRVFKTRISTWNSKQLSRPFAFHVPLHMSHLAKLLALCCLLWHWLQNLIKQFIDMWNLSY